MSTVARLAAALLFGAFITVSSVYSGGHPAWGLAIGLVGAAVLFGVQTFSSRRRSRDTATRSRR
ncbi:hypothetical protein [Microbacterium sp.]|uniref:hypothetical protein n=1 Tax=Microbacterium sp. TaxID=51671 RepID=UPI0039E5376F